MERPRADYRKVGRAGRSVAYNKLSLVVTGLKVSTGEGEMSYLGVSKKVVLIVEDDASVRSAYVDLLRDKCITLEVDTIAEAKSMYGEFSACLGAIIMDGEILGPPDTVPLVKWLREQGYTGPIVARSANKGQQKALMAAGCSHSCPKPDPDPLLGVLEELELV